MNPNKELDQTDADNFYITEENRQLRDIVRLLMDEINALKIELSDARFIINLRREDVA